MKRKGDFSVEDKKQAYDNHSIESYIKRKNYDSVQKFAHNKFEEYLFRSDSNERFENSQSVLPIKSKPKVLLPH